MLDQTAPVFGAVGQRYLLSTRLNRRQQSLIKILAADGTILKHYLAAATGDLIKQKEK
ncbi:hypothetical protein [Allochromatium palmeri]|uniref:Uncharacterized protein n=1 Tax=Allochromatium palmeri TaxID=231048 RepID=A0A6N8EAZ6_9GAMM|nr:hypothetical protein [Allochromatium palmeri]MTW20518.1 hypothetical protein [Allochromatium palmeri]